MHHALFIPEVLGNIIDFLAEDIVQRKHTVYPSYRTRKASQGALAVLARTCRTFSEPALNALWRRLRSLKPFLSATRGHVSVFAFNDEEWKTVLRYAPRVQELALRNDDDSIEILQALWFRTTLLLPNLRKLRWIYEDYTVIASIRLLLSPSLVHLHVWLGGGNHSSVLGFLESYDTLCPNLKSLVLFRPRLSMLHAHGATAVSRAISRAISRSSNLEALIFNVIDEAALVHIIGSPHLKRLDANLFDYQPDNLRRLACFSPFENLQVLKLHVEDLSSIVPYLKSHKQPFEEVSFEFRAPPMREVYYELFTALSSTTRWGTLRRITLLSQAQSTDAIPLQVVDFQVLSLLTAFSLHTLDAGLHNPVSLKDEELAQLIQAWPNLDTFYLNQHSGRNYQPIAHIPTLRGLLYLVERCPKLRHLGLCVDARNVPSLSKDEQSICNTAITKLSLAHSLIQGPVAAVALFLIQHFPSLNFLAGCQWDHHQQTRNMWRKVGSLIQEMGGYTTSSSGSEPESSDDSSSSEFLYC